GDQASIVGGAIKYVKELEQILQSLEAQKAIQSKQAQSQSIFSNFFILPQYSPAAATFSGGRIRAAVADVEVTMAERHANIKVLTKAQPRLLSKMITEFYSLGLTVLCLNLTTSQHMVLFTFSVKVEETVQVTCVDDIASAVHELVRRIQREN
ncbi:PREDICTED: transcription factor bHLH99-like, partial [Tarenaya hassleriana]|uniref:transcription factor bHLH99-like n=1 Tax=Tarenaya hassleriana TaxID=28532 RepID=UPI00053C1D67